MGVAEVPGFRLVSSAIFLVREFESVYWYKSRRFSSEHTRTPRGSMNSIRNFWLCSSSEVLCDYEWDDYMPRDKMNCCGTAMPYTSKYHLWISY